MISTVITDLVWIIISIVLGGYVLLFGRRELWATLGIIALTTTASLLAVFVIDANTGRDLIQSQRWDLVLASLLVGLLGVVLGRLRPNLAVVFIGLIAGGDLGLWSYDILAYIVTDIVNLGEQTADIVGLIAVIIGAVFGYWFVKSYRDMALIVIAMLVGTEIVVRGIGLSHSSSLTAVIALSIALVSVVIQYADYLREEKAGTPFTESLAEEKLRKFGDR